MPSNAVSEEFIKINENKNKMKAKYVSSFFSKKLSY